MEASKTVTQSKTQISQLMQPNFVNEAGTVFGGAILATADNVAYVCAARHAGPNCVTVSVDQVDFREPIYIGELVTFMASVNYIGRTSMEIGIKIFAEDLSTGKKRHTNSCYFTMVALNEFGKPTEVPQIIPESPIEKRRMEEGHIRREFAKQLTEKRKSLKPL